ncbi:unnamed protein product [Clonostachys rosea f. rosea IK726]|uniref:DUF7704 domain-containing protein n=2 Tax=Bionectria ochroleuca TaxID=29856 RepID=A0A8H7KEQ9_BIOOC|nr:unnamed protein product [Clonostachys rosea f. rosea IK726]
MTNYCLPVVPRIILGIIDPLAVTLAAISAISDPAAFYVHQVPKPVDHPHEIEVYTRVISLNIAALMLSIAASQVIGVWINKSASTIKWLMISHFLADILYLYSAYEAVGKDYFWNPSQWNSGMWGLIITDNLFNAARILSVLGVFGPLGSTKLKDS